MKTPPFRIGYPRCMRKIHAQQRPYYSFLFSHCRAQILWASRHWRKLAEGSEQIRRPLFARGTKAAGLDIVPLWTIMDHAFQLSGYLLWSVFKAQIPWDLPRQIAHSRSVCAPKSFCFQACFQGTKKQTNGFRGNTKTTNIDPEIHKHISVKSCCLQYFPCENLILRTPIV